MALLARGRHAVVYVLGFLAPSVITLGIVVVDRDVLIPNISLLYLPGIIVMAIYFGTKPALVAATVSAVEYDIFLLQPVFR
ncbi:MAG: hypothetical protein NVS2B16_01030 [Chloroflexota bacterium]